MCQKIDFLYKSQLLKKFINILARGGCYAIVEKIIYSALAEISATIRIFNLYPLRAKVFPIFMFFEVIFICRPLLQVRIWKFRRKGKKKLGKKGKALNTKVIPTNISREAAYNVVLRWLAQAIRAYTERTLRTAFLNEFYEILVKGRGSTLEKKKDLYSLIVANRSFAHFRW